MARFQREERERRERAAFEAEERIRQEQAARLLRARPTQRPLVASVADEREPEGAIPASPPAPQPFTKTPNVIFDRLIVEYRLDPYAALVLLYICRQTIGWNRTSVETLSLSEAAHALRIARSTVAEALHKLEAAGLISRERRRRTSAKGVDKPRGPNHEITRIVLTLPPDEPTKPSAPRGLP